MLYFLFRKKKCSLSDNPKRKVIRNGFIVLGLVILHIFAMIILEGMSFGDGLWLTMTTLLTVGYGDLSAKTDLGRAATIFLLYLPGIFLASQMLANFFDFISERKEKKQNGKWRYEMNNHIVLIGDVPNEYIDGIMVQLRSNQEYKEKNVLWIKPNPGLSKSLENKEIVYVCGNLSEKETIENSDLDKADTIVVFGDVDEKNLDTLIRIREINETANVIIEVSNVKSNARFERMGANQVIRPVRSYPEMAARAILYPGSEQLIENLFTTEGDECVLFKMEQEKNMLWKDVIMNIQIQNDIGTPVGYVHKGKIYTNPSVNTMVNFDGLFVVVNDKNQNHKIIFE